MRPVPAPGGSAFSRKRGFKSLFFTLPDRSVIVLLARTAVNDAGGQAPDDTIAS